MVNSAFSQFLLQAWIESDAPERGYPWELPPRS